jgi:hypothetical protein
LQFAHIYREAEHGGGIIPVELPKNREYIA